MKFPDDVVFLILTAEDTDWIDGTAVKFIDPLVFEEELLPVKFYFFPV